MTNEPVAHYIDTGAIMLWVASISQVLPAIAALLSVIWFAIRIGESETFQQLIGKYRWMKPKETQDGSNED